MNKTQLREEKQIVKELMAHKDNLTQQELEELLRLRCRTNFLSFARMITYNEFRPYKVHSLICDFIQRIADGDPDYSRTVISLPPRTGKSWLISRIFPAWQLGRNPKAQFIMSSYALNLSTENSRAVLDFLTSETFQWIFPECTVDKKVCNLTAIRSGKGGLIKTASAGGNVTGFGFGTISEDDLPGVGILDDLLADGNSMTVMDSTFNWVQTQFLTRALPNNAIISMGTRFHKDDVTGRLVAAAPDIWKILNVKAICDDVESDPLNRELGESHWPEFFPVQSLEIIRKNIGERDFNALYQGSPVAEAGAIFKNEWLGQFSEYKERYSYKFATVDTAYREKECGADYTCICIWGFDKSEQRLYLLDYVLDRFDFPDLQKKITDVAAHWKLRALYIESQSSGAPLIQTLKRFMKISIKDIRPTKDKILRANSVSPLVEAGLVSVYEHLPEFYERMNELCSFPYIKNDDFVDAFVYGVVVARDELGIKITSQSSGSSGDTSGIFMNSSVKEITEQFGRRAPDQQVITDSSNPDIIGIQPKTIPTKTRSKVRVSGLGKQSNRLQYR